MNAKERFAFLITPFLISAVLLITGIFVVKEKPEMLQGIVLICTGLVVVVLGVMMSLMMRLMNK